MPNPLPMPCRHVADCPPCFVLPTTNTSAEEEDCLQDFSIQWGNIQNNTPPLGSVFQANGCMAISRQGGGGGRGVSVFSNSCEGPSFSTNGQTDAFLEAANVQVTCMHEQWTHAPQEPPVCLNEPCTETVGGDGDLPPDPPFPVFHSHAASCRAFCPDGSPFTFTERAGAFSASNQILADRMAASFACREATFHRVCLLPIQDEACLNQPYATSVIATGRTLAVFPNSNFFELTSGALPPGLTFNGGFIPGGQFATITGTPTTAGTFTFNIRVTAPTGDFMDKQYTICVIQLGPATSLPDGIFSIPYSEQLTATSCAAQPINWTVVAGSLPPGLFLDNVTGIISGTPTTTGTFNFTVQATTEAP